MRIVIDRFEGDYAIVELPDRTMADLHRRFLPEWAKEGDAFEIRVETVSHHELKEQISRLMDEVWED